MIWFPLLQRFARFFLSCSSSSSIFRRFAVGVSNVFIPCYFNASPLIASLFANSPVHAVKALVAWGISARGAIVASGTPLSPCLSMQLRY